TSVFAWCNATTDQNALKSEISSPTFSTFAPESIHATSPASNSPALPPSGSTRQRPLSSGVALPTMKRPSERMTPGFEPGSTGGPAGTTGAIEAAALPAGGFAPPAAADPPATGGDLPSAAPRP